MSSDSKKDVGVAVRVQVLVEVTREGYGGDWKFDDMERQVTRESCEAVVRALGSNASIRVIGAEGVNVVLTRRTNR